MAHTPCKGKTAQPRAVALGNRHICVNPLALKEQKKHTLCVSAAPVGRTPENTRHTRRCPGLKSRLGLQPASAQTPPQHTRSTPCTPVERACDMQRIRPAKVKKGGISRLHAPPTHVERGHATQRIRPAKVKKRGKSPPWGGAMGAGIAKRYARGGNSIWRPAPPSEILNDLMT